MEILGFGPLEILLIIIIALIVMGPEDMMKNARRLGRAIRNFIRSDFWQELIGTSQEIRNLPRELIQETGLEEDIREIRQSTSEVASELNAEIRQAEKEVSAEVQEAARQSELATAAANREVISGMRGAPGALPVSEPAADEPARQTEMPEPVIAPPEEDAPPPPDVSYDI